MGKSVVDAGGVVVEILGTRTGLATKKPDLDTWVNNYKLPVTSLIDSPAGSGTKTLTFFTVRETCVIVDVRTMKIVKKINGSTAGSGKSSVAQLVPEILALLAAG